MAKKGGNNILAVGIGLNTEPLEQGFDDAVKASKDGMGKIGDEVVAGGKKVQESSQKAADKIQSLRAQFRQATQDAQQMAEKHGIMSQQAIIAASKAGELKDKIGDINTVITAFSADSKFTVVAGALQQAAGAASIVTGAMGLLGTESKATQEMLLKVQSALALTQGLAQIKEMGAAFTALQAVVVGQVIPSIMALGTATLIATGGLIVAITAATAAIISYNNSIDAETEAFKRANEEAKKNAEISKKIGDIVAETTSLRIAAMKDGIAKDKALLQEKTNQELRQQYDSYKLGEIAEFTYQQRVRYIREAAYNELAKIDKKYQDEADAAALKRAKAVITRKDASQPNELPRLGIAAPVFNQINNPAVDRAQEAFQKAAQLAQKHLEQLNNSINQSISNTLGATFQNIGQMLGQAITNGVDDPFATLAQILLQSFGSLMVQMGNAYIAFGVADSAFKASIFTGNPFGAIAAGIALVAAGSAISAIAGNMTKAPGTSTAPSGGGSFGNNNSQFKSFGGNLDNTIEIEGVVRGNNIELVNRKNMNKVGRSLIL